LQETPKEVGIIELLPYNAQEWYYILLGCVNAVIHGGLQPVFAILFGGLLGVRILFQRV